MSHTVLHYSSGKQEYPSRQNGPRQDAMLAVPTSLFLSSVLTYQLSAFISHGLIGSEMSHLGSELMKAHQQRQYLKGRGNPRPLGAEWFHWEYQLEQRSPISGDPRVLPRSVWKLVVFAREGPVKWRRWRLQKNGFLDLQDRVTEEKLWDQRRHRN
jgi:hypothetical protein